MSNQLYILDLDPKTLPAIDKLFLAKFMTCDKAVKVYNSSMRKLLDEQDPDPETIMKTAQFNINSKKMRNETLPLIKHYFAKLCPKRVIANIQVGTSDCGTWSFWVWYIPEMPPPAPRQPKKRKLAQLTAEIAKRQFIAATSLLNLDKS